MCSYVPILVSMASLLTSYKCKFMQTFPLMGREEVGSSPLPSNDSFSSKQYSYTFKLLPLCAEYVYVVSIRICNHSWKGNESKSTCSGCVGEPGLLPAPSPFSVDGVAGGGGGEGWRARSCLRILSGKGGFSGKKSCELKWRVFPAYKFGGFWSRINLASFHGGFYWRVFKAGCFSAFIWRVFMASKSSGF